MPLLPYLTLPHLTLLFLTSPYLTVPFRTSPYLTSPRLTLPYLTLPHLTLPHLTVPFRTLPYLILPHVTLRYLTLPCVASRFSCVTFFCFPQSFLMEFVDAQRVANNSPPCTFTPEAPLELRSMPMQRGQRPVGFLSFGERHERKLENC